MTQSILENKIFQKHAPYAVFLTLTFLVMLPLYGRGYIFLLDMVWGPNIQLENYLRGGISPNMPLILVFKALSFIVPTDIIQQALLSLILFLCGALMYKLASSFAGKKWAVAPGVFYMLNPYVYERFLAGHWLILFGYALFPLVVLKFRELLEKPSPKRFLIFTVIYTLYPMFSLHWAYISFFFLAMFFLFDRYERKGIAFSFSRKKARFAFLFIAVWTLVNSYWIFDFWGTKSILQKMTQGDLWAFQTQSDPSWGVVFNTLSLYGFWHNRYFLPKDIFSYWWVFTFLVFFLFLAGLYVMARKRSALALSVAFAFIPALVIAIGYGSAQNRPFIDFLFHNFPGFKGLRETQKLAGLLAFSYALFFPWGAKCIEELFLRGKRNEKLVKTVPILALLAVLAIPLVLVQNMLWGFDGQLKAHDYPDSWYKAEKILSSRAETGRTLFLPWHGYIELAFAEGDTVSNPAEVFFGANVIAGKNLDNVFLREGERGAWNEKVSNLLKGFETIDANMDFFKSENVGHIILAKTSDVASYGFLGRSAKLKNVFEDDDLVLYEIRY